MHTSHLYNQLSLTCPLMMRTQHCQTITTIFTHPPPPWPPTCIHGTNQQHACIPRACRPTAHLASYPLQMAHVWLVPWLRIRRVSDDSNTKRKVCKQVVNFIVFNLHDSSSGPHCLSMDNDNIDGDNDSPNHTWMLLETSNPQPSSSGQVWCSA